MFNRIVKILLLTVAICTVIGGIFYFVKDIIVSPKKLDLTNQYVSKIKNDIDQIYSCKSSFIEIDSLYEMIDYNIIDYNQDKLFSEKDYNLLLENFISAYTPVFIDQSFETFKRPVWSTDDNEYMQSRILKLKAYKVEHSGKIVSALENNSPNYKKLDSIQNVINCYNEAKALINKTSFDGISNVRIRISRAHELSSMPHLCNCREIVDGLNKLPLDIHSSHYRYIESIPGRFRNYRSYDRDSYSRNTEKLFEAMNDYSAYARELYGLSYRVSALKEECGDIYIQAIEYYNWQDACTENTQEAYRHYLDLYPDGPHSGEAKQNMQKMNNY